MYGTRATIGALLAAVVLTATCVAQAQTDTIRVYRVGSSSFSPEVLDAAASIVAANGTYVLQQVGSDYTRLDDIVKGSPTYDSWLAQNIPIIRSGRFDFVVIQTINWVYMNPAEHDSLFDRILPDMVRRIRAEGPEVILYDKWNAYGCYPEHVRNNNLFHIEAGVRAGVDMVTWVGGAVWELWSDSYFDRTMDFLYVGGSNGGGHPGSMVNYMTACNLSYLFTGISPVGSPVRNVKLQQWEMDSWNALSESSPLKSRVVNGYLVLTDWEADTLQRTAYRWHRQWSDTLRQNLTNPSRFAATMSEIAYLESEYGNYREWYTWDWLIEQLDNACTPYAPVLTASELQQLRDSTMLFSERVEHYARLFLTQTQYDQFVLDYVNYWLANNSKLRDDVYYQSLVARATAVKLGNTAEAARLTAENAVFLEILSLAAENLLMERITQAQREEFLSTFTWTGALDNYAPRFGAVQRDTVGNWQALAGVREAYFGVWTNVNLMDELKSSGFSIDVWLEADARFAQVTGTTVPRPASAATPAAAPVAVRRTADGYVFSPGSLDMEFTVNITSVTGRVVAALRGSTQLSYTLPRDLSSGVYLVDYRCGSNHRTERLTAGR